jgi:hypothetical protein
MEKEDVYRGLLTRSPWNDSLDMSVCAKVMFTVMEDMRVTGEC